MFIFRLLKLNFDGAEQIPLCCIQTTIRFVDVFLLLRTTQSSVDLWQSNMNSDLLAWQSYK